MEKAPPLDVEWIAAFNHALKATVIRIKFTDDVDPSEATPDRIRIEPTVKEMQLLAIRDEVVVNGQFDLPQRYLVTISRELKGERGYGLAAKSRCGATFPILNCQQAFRSLVVRDLVLRYARVASL